MRRLESETGRTIKNSKMRSVWSSLDERGTLKVGWSGF